MLSCRRRRAIACTVGPSWPEPLPVTSVGRAHPAPVTCLPPAALSTFPPLALSAPRGGGGGTRPRVSSACMCHGPATRSRLPPPSERGCGSGSRERGCAQPMRLLTAWSSAGGTRKLPPGRRTAGTGGVCVCRQRLGRVSARDAGWWVQAARACCVSACRTCSPKDMRAVQEARRDAPRLV